jgi:hypothetical protein
MVVAAGGAIALINGPLADAQAHLAVFLVALLIGGFANIYARVTGSPALVVIVHATYMIGACIDSGVDVDASLFLSLVPTVDATYMHALVLCVYVCVGGGGSVSLLSLSLPTSCVCGRVVRLSCFPQYQTRPLHPLLSSSHPSKKRPHNQPQCRGAWP